MPEYFINRNVQPNGDYEVHSLPCPTPPLPENRIDLGWHSSCHGAVGKAQASWPGKRINGCAYCCAPCHTS